LLADNPLAQVIAEAAQVHVEEAQYWKNEYIHTLEWAEKTFAQKLADVKQSLPPPYSATLSENGEMQNQAPSSPLMSEDPQEKIAEILKKHQQLIQRVDHVIRQASVNHGDNENSSLLFEIKRERAEALEDAKKLSRAIDDLTKKSEQLLQTIDECARNVNRMEKEFASQQFLYPFHP